MPSQVVKEADESAKMAQWTNLQRRLREADPVLEMRINAMGEQLRRTYPEHRMPLSPAVEATYRRRLADDQRVIRDLALTAYAVGRADAVVLAVEEVTR